MRKVVVLGLLAGVFVSGVRAETAGVYNMHQVASARIDLAAGSVPVSQISSDSNRGPADDQGKSYKMQSVDDLQKNKNMQKKRETSSPKPVYHYNERVDHTKNGQSVDAGPDLTDVSHAKPSSFRPTSTNEIMKRSLPWGLEKQLQISFEAKGGMVDGTAREIVYRNSYSDTDYLSELTWELKNVAMAGGGLTLRVFDWVTVQGEYLGAVSKGSGTMDDYDWLARGYSWTHWSQSDVDVNKGEIWSVQLGMELYDNKVLSFEGLLGYRKNTWDWSARGGRYIYSVYYFRDTAGTFSDEGGIDYRQTFDMFYLGGAASLDWNPVLISAYLHYSAGVRATAEDDHLSRGLHYKEDFDRGTYWGAGIQGRYTFPVGIYFEAAVEYQKIEEMRGDVTLSDDYGNSIKENDSVGIENEYTMYSLALGYEF
jgi:plasminogen activator